MLLKLGVSLQCFVVIVTDTVTNSISDKKSLFYSMDIGLEILTGSITIMNFAFSKLFVFDPGKSMKVGLL